MEDLNFVPSWTPSNGGDREPRRHNLGKRPMEIVDISESDLSRNISNFVWSVGLEDPIENSKGHNGDGGDNRDEAESWPANAPSSYQAYIQENPWLVIEQPHWESISSAFHALGINNYVGATIKQRQ